MLWPPGTKQYVKQTPHLARAIAAEQSGQRAGEKDRSLLISSRKGEEGMDWETVGGHTPPDSLTLWMAYWPCRETGSSVLGMAQVPLEGEETQRSEQRQCPGCAENIFTLSLFWIKNRAQHPHFGVADDPPFPTNTHTLLPLPLTQRPTIFGSGDFLGLAQPVCLATLKRNLFQGLVQPPLEPTEASNPHHNLARISQVCSPSSKKQSLLLEHNLAPLGSQSPPSLTQYHTLLITSSKVLSFPENCGLQPFLPPFFKTGQSSTAAIVSSLLQVWEQRDHLLWHEGTRVSSLLAFSFPRGHQ
ncbi:uncharacterized protein LOC116653496 [Coturnix japonica]|uniref:uncharacterized protein LOC116653496 n=1 Tax=Coturnix japonica TaxID=93934 RepID=UPI0013A5DAC8|nr:uncharacterized protein LOC116653496 [Coturnix japonica]